MPGAASHAPTSAAGLTQPACACHNARSPLGTPAAAKTFFDAGQHQLLAASNCMHAQADGSLSALPSRPRCNTPVWAQSMPCLNRALACCNVMRTPARDRRDSRLSSGDVCGTSSPAGRLDAPLAGALAVSTTVTAQPRRARLLATAAPARPAPMTTQLPGWVATSADLCNHAGLKTACSADVLLASNPHCLSADCKAECEQAAAKVVPRLHSFAMALMV